MGREQSAQGFLKVERDLYRLSFIALTIAF